MDPRPIVLGTEMRRLEKQVFKNKNDPAAFMQRAAEAMARYLFEFLPVDSSIVILVGKGNKGGDALCLAKMLIQKNYKPKIFALFAKQDISPLSAVHYEEILKKKYPIHTVKKPSDIICDASSIVIDGLLGTGISHPATGLISEVIRFINANHLPVIAIDIPSGMNPDSGEGENIFEAMITLTLGLPKLGLFINRGYCFSGEIHCLDIGFKPQDFKTLAISGYLLEKSYLSRLLPPIQRDRHKYGAGYLLCFAGSKMFSGAAKLSSLSALRSGAGIVSLFYSKEALGPCDPEIIQRPLATLPDEIPRAAALLIGPGLGRDTKAQTQIRHILKKNTLPAVIDADALFFLSKNPSFTLKSILPILTPHQAEMLALLKRKTRFENDQAFHTACQEFTDRKKVILVLKGAPTWIFSPGNIPFVSPFGDPGMATAGSGDVLTGIIGGLLAQKCHPLQAALLGVGLHGIAGEYAALSKTSYGLIASDIIEALPEAFQELLDT